jgi:O-antigen biosynthesis protein
MALPQQDRTEESFIHFNRQTGGLNIISMSATGGYDVLVDDKLTGIYLPEAKPLRANYINRILDGTLALAELHWRSGETGADQPVKKNLNAEWTLEGGNTAYLAAAATAGETPVTAVFHCPLQGPSIGVNAGTVYTFEALIGLHRAEGLVRLVFLDAGGTEIKVFENPVLQTFWGGSRPELYGRNRITVRSPDGAARLRIELVKGVTTDGSDSFLFFAQPSLVRSAETIGFGTLNRDLPDAAAIELFQRGLDLCYFSGLALPGEAVDGQFHKLAVRGRESGKLSNSIPVALPDSLRCTGTIHGLEGSVLVARADLPKAWTNRVTVGLWIDGQPHGQIFYTEAGTGKIRLPLPLSACDGRPHIFEIRLGLSGQLLDQYAAIGPVSTTPWDALQKYAGMPLPAHMAPIAAYRYASLCGTHRSPASGGPSLHELHDILVEGFERPRKEFRVLPFAKVKAPDVSIVIPVHNKFDVTYVCLAALLFATSRASFEVIVVDDGSSDTTLRLKDIAPGVTCVRHESAQGFVGACNAGAEAARGRYIVFLNNDTEPTANWLDELVFVFENFDNVGLAGAKLIYPDGLLQEAGGIVWETGDPWNYGRRGNASDPRFSYTRICDYLSGAAIMIAAALWKEVGGFSKEFAPAYFEDTDLAFKVRHAGKKVVFAPRSIVVHYEGLSNGTSETAASGLKRFQEINRPKFKRKWPSLFAGNGKAGLDADLAKDRGIAKRVVFFDNEFPRLDQDAGSYAAIQEIRMFQALGCKVTYVPTNMAYLARHTDDLQRIGVETIHLPFYADVTAFLRARGAEFDLAYITRYGVAEQLLASIGQFAKQARTVINIADLHFLRAIRDALAGRSEAQIEGALRIRDAELAALNRAELVLSYSAIEQVVITSHLPRGPKTAIMPWVVDSQAPATPFANRKDIAFIGGYRHPPNVAAVKFFADEVMPLLRKEMPGMRFLVYGSNVPPEIERLAGDGIVIKGFVADIDEVFSSCRLFVAPLLSGAGMKGKVLDCIAAGIPSVLSPIAAEGIDLRGGLDALIASRPEEWVTAIARLYGDEKAWTAMSASVQQLAKAKYSFAAGVAGLQEALAAIEFFLTADKPALHINSARPRLPTASASTRDAQNFVTAAMKSSA